MVLKVIDKLWHTLSVEVGFSGYARFFCSVDMFPGLSIRVGYVTHAHMAHFFRHPLYPIQSVTVLLRNGYILIGVAFQVTL